VVIAAGVLIVATVGLLATVKTEDDPGNTSKEAFDLPQLQGEGRVRLADFKGQPTVVNFFASWCSACDFELPGFAKLSDELKGRVNFVGVDALETGDPMYMPKRHGLTSWPLAQDVNGSNGSGLHDSLGGGNSMPITAFYDASGKLLHVGLGALPESSLRAKLHELYGV
jgi:thiol-disulfide isomerase/thioredoxin